MCIRDSVTDQSFQRYITMKDVKKHNWFLNRDNNLCYFYFVKNSVKHIIVVEPSDEMGEMAKPYLNLSLIHIDMCIRDSLCSSCHD